jgi:hypothetical protein
VNEGAPPAGDGEIRERVMILSEGEEHEALPGDRMIRHRIDVKATNEPSADGTTRRKVTFRGEGDAEGTLELSVKR